MLQISIADGNLNSFIVIVPQGATKWNRRKKCRKKDCSAYEQKNIIEVGGGAKQPQCFLNYQLSFPPIPRFSADGQPALLPPEQAQQLNLRSTGMLNNVQRLFSHHMIQTFGCDYSASGVGLETLLTKLRNFLELRTADGPRHDTYLVFYSGHTRKESGAWALAGKQLQPIETYVFFSPYIFLTGANYSPINTVNAFFFLYFSDFNVR